MTQQLEGPAATALHGAEGDLVLIRISADARQLEDILDAVAELPFPINPEIHHAVKRSRVEFPAYSQRVDDVRSALLASGFPADCLQVVSMFQDPSVG